MEAFNGAKLPPPELEEDPKNIPMDRVKAASLVYNVAPADAYRILLAQDLLKRVDISTVDTQTKIVLRILISMVVGEVPKKTLEAKLGA